MRQSILVGTFPGSGEEDGQKTRADVFTKSVRKSDLQELSEEVAEEVVAEAVQQARFPGSW